MIMALIERTPYEEGQALGEFLAYVLIGGCALAVVAVLCLCVATLCYAARTLGGKR